MKNKLTYFISNFSMFGIGFFLLFKFAGKDAWISLILGSLLGIIIIYIYSKLKTYLNDSKNTFTYKLFEFIFFIFNIYLITLILILLPMFVNSFYLLYTPKIIVIIPFLLLAIYLASKEKRVLETLSNFSFVISITIIIVYILLLSKYVNVSNLTPALSTPRLDILTSSLIFASISSIPHIITLNFHNTDFKYELKVYLTSCLFLLGIILYTILCLGEPLIKIYSFPEYAVLKQIKILDFIENIENISTFIWYYNMFITLAVLITNIKEDLPKTYHKITYPLIILLTIFLGIVICGSNYRIIITIFYTYPLVLFIFFSIFFLFLLILKIKQKKIPH